HAEDGIRDRNVTGVQTCALPISSLTRGAGAQGQGGELVEVLLAGDLRTVESGQGGLLDPGGVFAGDDEGVFDLSGVDHVRGQGRSEERRVGKECRSRWSACTYVR